MENKPTMTSDELNQFLDHFGMNADELAETLSITKPAVDHWLSGRREVPATTVRLLQYWLKHPTRIGAF